MEENKYLQDISEIRNLMNKSTKFLSLSGLSGIMAGIYALIGAVVSYMLIGNQKVIVLTNNKDQLNLLFSLLLVAFLVLAFSVLTAYFFSFKKAKKTGEKMWDVSSKNLLKSFLIPLVTGGIFAIISISNNHYGIISSITLIFYGLGLVNSAKYTYGTIYYLGILEIITGLLAGIFS
jgi:hypothetical protein